MLITWDRSLGLLRGLFYLLVDDPPQKYIPFYLRSRSWSQNIDYYI